MFRNRPIWVIPGAAVSIKLLVWSIESYHKRGLQSLFIIAPVSKAVTLWITYYIYSFGYQTNCLSLTQATATGNQSLLTFYLKKEGGAFKQK